MTSCRKRGPEARRALRASDEGALPGAAGSAFTSSIYAVRKNGFEHYRAFRLGGDTLK
jgi:hypothetical protein